MKRYNFKSANTIKGRFWSLLLMASIAVSSCKEAPIGQIPVDSNPPATLSDVKATPTYGGAHITYTLPDEEDISYVKCEFEYKGKLRTVCSSIYKSSLDVEGLGDTQEIELKLSVIDHSENASKPQIIKVVPLDPPMTAIFNSFEIVPTFGGVSVSWSNPAKMMAGISFLAAGDAGKLELKDMVFSSLPTGTKSLRGFNTDQRTFAVCISDKYANLSDTFKIEISPLYEAMFDKKKFKDGHLSGDNFSVNNNRPISNIWDGNLATIWHTSADAGYTIPQYFTIDLGVQADISRIVVHNRSEQYPYAQHNLRLFDVYGTNSLVKPIDDVYYSNGSWKADWTLLANCEIIKPSGSSMGTNTAEDMAAHNSGFEFEFKQGVPKMRYIRFVVHETWAKTPALHVAEVSIFGNDK